MSKILNKEQRQQCWAARDAYWECVTVGAAQAGVENFDDVAVQKLCLKQRAEYEAKCPKTWIDLFDKKRDFELFKAKKFEEQMKSKASSVKK